MIRGVVTAPYRAWLWLPQLVYRRRGVAELAVMPIVMFIPNVLLLMLLAAPFVVYFEGFMSTGVGVASLVGLSLAQVVLAYRRENDSSKRPWRELDDPESLSMRIARDETSPSSLAPKAFDVMAAIDGYPEDAGERIRLSLDLALLDAGNQERVLANSDYDAEAVAERLFELEADGYPPWRAVERFAFVDPDVYDAYWDRLFDDPADMDFHRVMACCHVARANQERRPALVDALVGLVDDGTTGKTVTIALGELSVHDDDALAALRTLADHQNPDVRERAHQVRSFYLDAPDGRLDRVHENRRAGPGEVLRGNGSSAGDDSGSPSEGSGRASDATPGGLAADYSYDCESCGATLWDEMDITSTSTYSCGVCGHELDDQEGAKQTYLYG